MKILRIAIAVLSVSLLTVAYERSSAQSDSDPDLKLPSEIQLERVNHGCKDCDDHSITLRRDAGAIFADATVIRTNLPSKQQREGKLSAYYYNHLIALIKSQGVMDMDDTSARIDSLIVTMKISIGDRQKTIGPSSEGRVPPKLWGLYMAIDGAVAHTKWSDAK